MTMLKKKKEDYIEKYEKNLILFGLFTFIIFGVMFLTFLLPRIYGFYNYNYPSRNKGIVIDNLGKSSPEINYKSGRESFKKNDYSLALNYFMKAVESEPDNIDYLTELAIAHYRLKNYDEAVRNYDRIMSLDSNNAFAYNSVGNICWIKKDFEKAEFYFRKAIELNPNLIVSYSNLALMLSENGKKDEAVKILVQGAQANPDNMELKYYLKIINNE